MSREDLRGRVRTVTIDQTRLMMKIHCRAATIDGKAVDFTFALGFEDDRLPLAQPGSRVTYSTRQALGVWGLALVKGAEDRPIPVDKVTTTVTGGTYGDALLKEDNGAPPAPLLERVIRDAEAMGITVRVGNEDERESRWWVEVEIPGRGKVKHYKVPDETWDELLTTAGLTGTL